MLHLSPSSSRPASVHFLLTWRTSKHGQHGELLHESRNALMVLMVRSLKVLKIRDEPSFFGH